jgi:broad specificity phosphatase PhoE/predicted kinase
VNSSSYRNVLKLGILQDAMNEPVLSNQGEEDVPPLPHLDSAETYNPMPHKLTEGENATPLEVIGSTATDKLVIIMVGLPATGKTHIAKRICRFLSFFHDIPSQIFNVGDYRRQLCGTQLSADFYDPENKSAMAARLVACDAAIADMVEYLQQDGVRVAALDATNSTKDRRRHVVATLRQAGIYCKKMFVESICDSQELLEENIRKVKLATPDYRDVDPEDAIRDFHQRRKNYMSVYEPVDESDGPHVKIINSRQFIVTNIRGYLPLKVVHFVMNLHTLPRTFFLTRHGQSEYNVLGKIGGDSGLSANGIKYAKRLAEFAKDYIAKVTDDEMDAHLNASEGEVKSEAESSNERNDRPERPCRLWTSTLRRTKETAQFIEHNMLTHVWDNGDSLEWLQFRPMARRNLDELYAGVCDGLTYKEIEALFPDEFQRRQDDKLAYRYPRGESTSEFYCSPNYQT